ncbi:MAG: endonuclease/exonuclease/phosphatase family protein, partial [Planctomycetota bacterium]
MLSTLLALALLQPTTQPGVNTANLAIDGDVSEWPVDTSFFHATNTDQLFVKLQGYGMRSLTGGAETLVLLLDVDGDKRTGADLTAEGGTVGIDLRVDFNMQWRTPLVRDGETIRDRRRGSKVTGFQADGTPVDVHQWDIGLISGPTYAAGNFEARIQTEVTGHSAAVFTLPDVGEVRGVVMIQERGGPADRPSRTLRRARLTGMDSGVLPERDTPAIPEMTDDVIRVASWNLLYDKPIENPTPFAKVIAEVDADVWLLQEWTRADRISQPQVEAWFAEHVGDGWHIETSQGQGVVIASRFSISATGPDAVDADPNDNSPHPVRFAAAVLDAPSGPMTVATVHLKCCGSYQSSEDKKR